jgi:hypothetical protein
MLRREPRSEDQPDGTQRDPEQDPGHHGNPRDRAGKAEAEGEEKQDFGEMGYHRCFSVQCDLNRFRELD